MILPRCWHAALSTIASIPRVKDVFNTRRFAFVLSDFASRNVQLALDGIQDTDSSREDAAAAAFSAFIPRLSNVTRLVIDASLDAHPDGMRFTHIHFACIRALQTFMPSRALYSLTFRNIQLHWRVLVIIAQCSSLKELRMEDVAISRNPLGGQSLYPTEALAAIHSPKPVLETLVLHNPDLIGRPMMCYWRLGMFGQFIRGLFVGSETGGSHWADASKLQRLEYYEGIWSVLVEEYWDVQMLLDNVPDLKEFVWRWRHARPFDLSHLPNVTVRQCERPKC
ncbi:hypothetical protein BDZ89DRAFT_614651 [Hymenopellis radicata]|nr:hypothetical protein BDZ89DRAFT_614651 [Hymenopellis radicata]